MGHFYQPPVPFQGGAQPYGPRDLPAAVTAVEVDSPPFQSLARAAAFIAIIAAWQPPDPSPGFGAGQPLGPKRLPVAVLASKVDNPPFQDGGRSAAVHAELVGLAQPDPWTYSFEGASQPFGPRTLNPALLAVPINNPPFANRGRSPALAAAIVGAWQPPDPQPYFGASQGLAPHTLNPALIAVEVDNPPTESGGQFDGILAEIVQAWQPDPWVYAFHGGWQPYGGRSNAVLAAVRTDRPPPGGPQRIGTGAIIRAAWEPPAPLVQPGPQLKSPVVTTPGLSLVGGFLETGPGGSGTYTIPNSHIVNIGRVAPCQVVITWLATGQSISADWFGSSDWFAPSDYFGTSLTQFVNAWAEIALSQDGVTWGPWVKYAPATYVAWAYKARMQLVSSDSGTIAVLEEFSFAVDVPTRSDHYNNQTIGAGGTTIVFQPDGAGSSAAFNGGPNGATVPHIQVTILGATAGDQVLVTGITAAHCTVQVVNGGVGVARNCNVLAIGY